MALLSDINDYSKQDILVASGLTEKDDIDLIVGGPPVRHLVQQENEKHLMMTEVMYF